MRIVAFIAVVFGLSLVIVQLWIWYVILTMPFKRDPAAKPLTWFEIAAFIVMAIGPAAVGSAMIAIGNKLLSL